MRAATVEGSPKTPLPMMEFTTKATRLQRPMARISSWLGGFGRGVSIRAFVSQPGVILDKQSSLRRSASPARFADSGQALSEVETGGPVVFGDLGTDGDCTVG